MPAWKPAVTQASKTAGGFCLRLILLTGKFICDILEKMGKEKKPDCGMQLSRTIGKQIGGLLSTRAVKP